MTWGSGNEILKIGNLCSIAQEVMFILDDHYTDHVSSYGASAAWVGDR